MVDVNWDQIESDYKSILKKLSDSILSQKERIQLQKKSSQYLGLLSIHKQIVKYQKDIVDLEKQKQKETDEQMRILFEEEISVKKSEEGELEKKLGNLLYPSDQMDERSIFLEIRAGAGGQEAALFVTDLYKMYSNYGLSKGWNVSIVDFNKTEIGGFKELIIYIKGKNVYKHLKFESGVHRVQRVPATETAGRIHTSTVTVAVLPEAKEVDVKINPQDIRIDVFRASGAGGQHVNTTDSAVRITHFSTGIVVSCQDERSQIKNKARALKVLAARIFKVEKEKAEAERRAERKELIGMGMRAEKVRTYNFPQNRITDHRINLTLKKLDIIMTGNLDDLIDSLLDWDLKERQKSSSLLEQSE
ncbi:peptide chain release factor 1 [Candidatus Babeliales bacterium]|nr:peptide chain release factor 1 [Candidatus Babeliales bacterium]